MKRFNVMLNEEGAKVNVNMGNEKSNAEKPITNKKAVLEQVHQEGNRDKIVLKGNDVTLRNVEQKGDDNSIKIG